MRTNALIAFLALALIACGDSGTGSVGSESGSESGGSGSTGTSSATSSTTATDASSASGSQSASAGSSSSSTGDTVGTGPISASDTETSGTDSSGTNTTNDTSDSSSSGSTGLDCNDECDEGQISCAGDDALHACVLGDLGCWQWGPPESCADGEVCAEGICVQGCVDACNLGDAQCSGDGASKCIDDPDSSCTMWGEPVACSDGQVCEGGACVDVPDLCVDDCVWTKASINADVDLYAVWGSDAKAVWAVGESGTALYYNGIKWVSVDSGVSKRLDCVHGSAADDVYAVTSSGKVIRWDGSEWQTYYNLSNSEDATCLTVVGEKDVLVIAWDSLPEKMRLYRIQDGVKTVLASDDVYIWSPNGSKPKTMSMMGFSPTDAVILAYHAYRWDGTLKGINAPSSSFGLWADSTDLFYAAAGSKGVGHRWKKDKGWKIINPGTGGYVHMFSGTGADRIFAAGENKGETAAVIAVFDGIGWSPAVLPDDAKSLFATWAAPTGEVFAVGKTGTIVMGK